jgi:peroxiredoxin
MALTEELPIYKATYDLVLVIFNLAKNFRKGYKYIIRTYLLILMIFFGNNSFAQQIEIKIIGTNGKALLFKLSGEKIVAIDSVNSGEGVYRFSFDKNKHHTGFYRLTFKNSKWLDFICDGKDVAIETEVNNILDSLKVIKSESNKIYYEFVKLNTDYKTKTELLQLMLARYPKEDGYYQTTKEKLIQVQEDYNYFVNVTAQVNPKSFIARYVRSAQLPVIDTEIPTDKQLPYLKSHALDNVNFNDDGLIFSDAFTNKSIEYLTYYKNPQLLMGLLEKEFEAAIDTILNKAKVNDIVYKHIVEYLLDGFKKFGFDNSVDYIVENYVIKDDLCLDEKLGNTIERRIQQARNFKVGNVVPNIVLPDSNGLLVELNKLNADKTLIIFYASWCPHCQSLLPKVYDIYKKQEERRFEVLAISIDSSRTDWLNFIRNNNLDWINVSDLKDWDGKATTEYFIYATPTMFLVDKRKEVIAKPLSIEELKNFL